MVMIRMLIEYFVARILRQTHSDVTESECDG